MPWSVLGLVGALAAIVVMAAAVLAVAAARRQGTPPTASFHLGPHSSTTGDMYTPIVFVYTTASDFSNPARGPTVFTGVVAS